MAAYDLKSILPRIRGTPWNFGLYRGEDGDQLLVTEKPPTRADLAQLEADCGKPRQILKGVVYHQDGKLVFGMKIAPAPAWEKMISSTLQHRKCGQYLPVTLRQLAASESDEVDASGDPHAAQAKAEWEAVKAELLPAIREALGNAKLKEKATTAVAAASAAEKTGLYERATAAFLELRRVLKPEAPAIPSATSIDSGSGVAAILAASTAAAAVASAPGPAPVIPEMPADVVTTEPAPAAEKAPPAEAVPAVPAGGDDLDDLLAALEGS